MEAETKTRILVPKMGSEEDADVVITGDTRYQRPNFKMSKVKSSYKHTHALKILI